MQRISSFIMSLILICSVWALCGQDVARTFGKGMFNFVARDSSYSVQLAPRMQYLTLVDWPGGRLSNAPQSNFLIRRARLKMNGFAYTPKLKYKIELGLSNRDIGGASIYTSNAPRYILDAVVKWNFYANWGLWAGQTKLPGNLERVISSGNLQLVDRSLLNSKFNIDREAGIQLRHHFLPFGDFLVREKLALSQGEGRNVTSGNQGGLQYTARLECLPFGAFAGKGDYSGADLKREPTTKLMLGVTYDFNDNAVKSRSNQGSYLLLSDGSLHETDITTLYADLMMKYRGFSLMAEYAKRTADAPEVQEEDGTPTGQYVEEGTGLNIAAGILLAHNWELSARYTNVDIRDRVTTQYTGGLSRYIVGHKLKVQSDLTWTFIDRQKRGVAWRMQFDLHL